MVQAGILCHLREVDLTGLSGRATAGGTRVANEMPEFASAWIGVGGLLAMGLGVWTRLLQRLTIVETRQKSDDNRFEQIMQHLQRIEEKLDRKADRFER